MLQLFLIAFRNLVQHRKRTLMLGGAIAGVSALLVFLQCLSTGVHLTMIESATTLSSGHINVAGFFKVTAGQSAPIVTNYKPMEALVRKTLPDLDFIAARGRGWGKLISESGSLQAALAGIEIENEPNFKRLVHTIKGDLNELTQPNTILLFEDQARKLGVQVGDSIIVSSLTSRGTSNTIDLRVIAIAQDMGLMSQWNAFTSANSIRKLYQMSEDVTGALQVYIRDIKRIPQDMDLLRTAFAQAGYDLMDREGKPFWLKFESVNREDWTGQKIDLTTWEEESSFLKWTLTAVDGLSYVMTLILLTIIGIGIMNSMWIAIRERTREIGTLRAIGMQRLRVLAMFVIEAFTLGSLATIAGTLLGLTFSGILHVAHLPVPEGAKFFLMSSTLRFAADPRAILAGVSTITACTTLIAMIPSLHAARLKPITAMQHIG